MSWIRNSTKVPQAFLVAIFLMAAASASAKVLIVRSTGPSAKSYPLGRALTENARITLKAGDTVVLFGSAGTLTLRGPGTFAATVLFRPGPLTVTADRRAVTAVVRGGPVPHPADADMRRAFTVWQIDVTQSGSFCLLRSTDVMLWRPDAKAPTTVTISAAGRAPQTAEWPAGRNSISWAPVSPFVNGGAYTLRQAGGDMPSQIRVYIVKLASNDPQAVATILIKHGCGRQLDALVDEAEDQTPLIAPNILPMDHSPRK